MSYQNRNTWKTDTDASFTSGVNKWTGQEVEDAFLNLADSVAWESQKFTATPPTYNCSNGNLQEMTITGNSNLTISNVESGKYYTLIKKGNFTLGLPSSQFSASGSILPVGTVVLTFLYDGTNYFFNYSTYTAT